MTSCLVGSLGRGGYAGRGVLALAPVGYVRFEDPADEVGVETHRVTDGVVLYQIPMTYRDGSLQELETRRRG